MIGKQAMQGKKYEEYRDNRSVISLFSGAMGLDLGLKKAGLNIVLGQDSDLDCVATMKTNGCNVYAGDIREIDPQNLLEQAKMQIGEPFLICGGPPCQPFSTAGKRLGINDPRGSLFMEFIRMIDYIRPRFFVMENVKGIMSAPLKHIPIKDRDANYKRDEFGTVLDVVLSEFKKLGYKTVYGVLDAVNYGSPQFRERFILIGKGIHGVPSKPGQGLGKDQVDFSVQRIVHHAIKAIPSTDGQTGNTVIRVYLGENPVRVVSNILCKIVLLRLKTVLLCIFHGGHSGIGGDSLPWLRLCRGRQLHRKLNPCNSFRRQCCSPPVLR